MDCEERLKKFLALILTALLFGFSSSAYAADEIPNPNAAEGVYIVPGSEINLVSRSSSIPIQIQNDFASDVVVHVHVQPSNLRVSAARAVAVKVPGFTSVTAKVPIEAIANGDVDLRVWITTFSGYKIGKPVILKMNVNADIEAVMLIGFASAVAVLLGLGIFRTVRKGRKK